MSTTENTSQSAVGSATVSKKTAPKESAAKRTAVASAKKNKASTKHIADQVQSIPRNRVWPD